MLHSSLGEIRSPVLFFFFLSFFLFIFYASFIPRGKVISPGLVKATAAARAALPIPTSVCSIFVCSNNRMAASVWDF